MLIALIIILVFSDLILFCFCPRKLKRYRKQYAFQTLRANFITEPAERFCSLSAHSSLTGRKKALFYIISAVQKTVFGKNSDLKADNNGIPALIVQCSTDREVTEKYPLLPIGLNLITFARFLLKTTDIGTL